MSKSKKKPEEYLFEEYHEISDRRSWAILIGLILFLIITPVVIHRLLPDREREWKYGAVEQIPGESIYSTVSPDPGPVAPAETDKIPRQIVPRPGARPLEKLPPAGYQMEDR